MMLRGNDIANVNGPSALNRCSGSFVILKASEGTRFKDPYHDAWASQARTRGLLVGHYHYAHLTNDPVAEADYFVQAASPRDGEVMALDFEPYGQPTPASVYPAWIATFLTHVNTRVGGRCWIYLNDDMAGRATSHAEASQLAVMHAAPLWKARYTSTPGYLYGWPGLTAWQYGGTGLDADVAYLDAAGWRALGAGGHGSPTTSATPSTPTPTPVAAPSKGTRMFVAAQKTRGTWLLAPGYAFHFDTDSWGAFAGNVLPGSGIPIRSFPDGPVGELQFDRVHAVMTHPAKPY